MSLSPTLAAAFRLTPPEKSFFTRQPVKVFFPSHMIQDTGENPSWNGDGPRTESDEDR